MIKKKKNVCLPIEFQIFCLSSTMHRGHTNNYLFSFKHRHGLNILKKPSHTFLREFYLEFMVLCSELFEHILRKNNASKTQIDEE